MTATTAATRTAAMTATTTAIAWTLLCRVINSNGTTIKLAVIQSVFRLVGISLSVCYETKASGTTSLRSVNNLCLGDLSNFAMVEGLITRPCKELPTNNFEPICSIPFQQCRPFLSLVRSMSKKNMRFLRFLSINSPKPSKILLEGILAQMATDVDFQYLAAFGQRYPLMPIRTMAA